MVSITRPKGEEKAKKNGQKKPGKGSEIIKERKRKQKERKALRMKLAERQKDIEATTKPAQEKQGEKVQEVEGEDQKVVQKKEDVEVEEDQKVTQKEDQEVAEKEDQELAQKEDKEVGQKEEDQEVALKQEDKKVAKKKKRKKKKKVPAKKEENLGGLTKKDAVGTSGKTMKASKAKKKGKKGKVTAKVKKDGSGPAYPKEQVVIKFEENNLMTLYDGVWVMKKRVPVLNKIKEKKKKAIIAARKGDENVYGDELTAVELQMLNEKKMKKEMRNAHRFLRRKLIKLEKQKMKE